MRPGQQLQHLMNICQQMTVRLEQAEASRGQKGWKLTSNWGVPKPYSGLFSSLHHTAFGVCST